MRVYAWEEVAHIIWAIWYRVHGTVNVLHNSRAARSLRLLKPAGEIRFTTQTGLQAVGIV